MDRLLLRGISANVIGLTSPMLVGIFSVPVLLHGLGVERFGLLTLIWLALGYFVFLDLGLTRALVPEIVNRTKSPAADSIMSIILGALVVVGVLGVIGGLLLAAAAQPIAGLMHLSPGIADECVSSIRVLGLAVPIVVMNNVLEAALAARERFVSINICRVVGQVGAYLAPLLLLTVTVRVDAALALLAAIRGCVTIALLAMAYREFEGGLEKPSFTALRSMLRTGRWVTVSNVIGPLMAYLDRFLVASKFPVATVAYYSTPFSVISKVAILTSSAVGPFYRRFSAAESVDEARSTVLQSSSIMGAMVMGPIVIACLFSQEILTLWLGPDFAARSYEILSVLAIGIFFNSIAQPAFAYLQSTGRAHLSAILHTIELPLYVGLLWWCIDAFGVLGAALAWTLRTVVDGVALHWMLRRSLQIRSRELVRVFAPPSLLAATLPLCFEGGLLARSLVAAAFGVLGLAMIVRDRPWAPLSFAPSGPLDAGMLEKE